MEAPGSLLHDTYHIKRERGNLRLGSCGMFLSVMPGHSSLPCADRVSLSTMPGMTKGMFVLFLSRSVGPQHFLPVAAHLRLPRQSDRRRHQDHQRLRAEDCDREVEAVFGTVEPADDSAERGADGACA